MCLSPFLPCEQLLRSSPKFVSEGRVPSGPRLRGDAVTRFVSVFRAGNPTGAALGCGSSRVEHQGFSLKGAGSNPARSAPKGSSMVEQQAHNLCVAGSNPAQSTLGHWNRCCLLKAQGSQSFDRSALAVMRSNQRRGFAVGPVRGIAASTAQTNALRCADSARLRLGPGCSSTRPPLQPRSSNTPRWNV